MSAHISQQKETPGEAMPPSAIRGTNSSIKLARGGAKRKVVLRKTEGAGTRAKREDDRYRAALKSHQRGAAADPAAMWLATHDPKRAEEALMDAWRKEKNNERRVQGFKTAAVSVGTEEGEHDPARELAHVDPALEWLFGIQHPDEENRDEALARILSIPGRVGEVMVHLAGAPSAARVAMLIANDIPDHERPARLGVCRRAYLAARETLRDRLAHMQNNALPAPSRQGRRKPAEDLFAAGGVEAPHHEQQEKPRKKRQQAKKYAVQMDLFDPQRQPEEVQTTCHSIQTTSTFNRPRKTAGLRTSMRRHHRGYRNFLRNPASHRTMYRPGPISTAGQKSGKHCERSSSSVDRAFRYPISDSTVSRSRKAAPRSRGFAC